MLASQDIAQRRAVMRFYAGYRQILASALCILFFFGPDQLILGSVEPSLFTYTSPIYLIFAIALILRHSIFTHRYTHTEIFAELLVDVAALVIMSYASGGADSGLQLLIFVTISVSGASLPARLSLAIAALASISALTEVAAHSLSDNTSTQQFVVAGLMGIAYFSIAIAIRYLSIKIITAQNLAEHRRNDIERLSKINQMIVQRMQTGVMLISPQGHIRMLNEAAEELLGKFDTDAAGQDIAPRELISLAQAEQQGSVLFNAGEGKVEVYANMITLGEHNDSDRLVYLENISKISQRAQNMKLASLGRFTASIAHEIRNPLSAISHAAQLLRENPELSDDDKRFTHIIESNAHRMNGIIKNILEMSRGRSPQPTHIDLKEWLSEFCTEWRPTNGERVAFKISHHASQANINVDLSQLRQIIANIAENGVRYGAEAHGIAKIHFQLSSNPSSEAVILDIIDNGPGIPAEQEDKIFEPFFTTENKGNGLGLYLCRELCLANQISIHYRRDKDHNSCFRLQFSHPSRGGLPSRAL